MILEGPYPVQSNRIIRKYQKYEDNFLRVDFRDEVGAYLEEKLPDNLNLSRTNSSTDGLAKSTVLTSSVNE
jgi:hypothetical protein